MIFMITIWDWTLNSDAAEEPYGYVVIGDDYEEAKQTALEIHRETQVEGTRKGEPSIDHEMSFQITCAADKNGTMYDILHQKASEVRSKEKELSQVKN
jgi:hypothetical protein